jgi:YD repeat-containing protein
MRERVMGIRSILASMGLALPLLCTSMAIAGDSAGATSNLDQGDGGCPAESCPEGATCQAVGAYGGAAGPLGDAMGPGIPPSPGSPPCAPTAVGDPIDTRSGNVFYEESLFRTSGEMPLRFSLYYNSRHEPIEVGGGNLRGRWTYTYSDHLLIRVYSIGTGDSTVELRRADGQALFFVEPGSSVLSATQPGSSVEFSSRERGNHGSFRGLGFDPAATHPEDVYAGFEYTRPDGYVETYDPSPPEPSQNPNPGDPARVWVTSRLRKIESPQGGEHLVAPPSCVSGSCVVTVTRTQGGSMTITYPDLGEPEAGGDPLLTPQPNTTDDYCFRCPESVTLDGQITWTIDRSPTAPEMIVGVVFPDDPDDAADQNLKSYVYATGSSDPHVEGGCTPIWECDTALVGVIDEEGWRRVTWRYRRAHPTANSTPVLQKTAWAFESYHGTTQDLEDHVELTVTDSGQTPIRNTVVTRSRGHQEIHHIVHDVDENIGPAAESIPLRAEYVADYRSVFPGQSATRDPENVEPVRNTFTYWMDASFLDPPAPGHNESVSGLLRSVAVESMENATVGPRRVTEWSYTNDRLVSKKTEKAGPYGSEATLRVTEYLGWNTKRRQPGTILVSATGTDGGTNGTEEWREERTFTPEHRLEKVRITDGSDHTLPYVTGGRVREVERTYQYYGNNEPGAAHCAGNYCVKTMVINGARLPGDVPGGLDDAVTYSYTPKGLLSRVEDALGNATIWEDHDAFGQPGKRTDPGGRVTCFRYNPRGWLKSMEMLGPGSTCGAPSDARSWSYGYYANGLLRRVTFPDVDGFSEDGDGSTERNFLEYAYEQSRKIKSVTNKAGDVLAFDREWLPGENANSGVLRRITRTLTRAGASQPAISSAIVEDSRGRLYKVEGGNGQETWFSYELRDRLKTLTEKNPAGADLVTTFHYDGLGRIQSVDYPDLGSVSMAYGLRDRVIEVTDGNGVATEYIVDGFGDPIQIASPDSGTRTLHYDGAGNVIREDVVLADGSLSSRHWVHDAANRVSAEWVQRTGDCFGWSYDAADSAPFANRGGRLSKIVAGTWNASTSQCDEATSGVGYRSSEFGYDDFGRPEIVRQVVASSTGIRTLDVRYAFDASGNLDAVTYPSLRVVRYARTDGLVDDVEFGTSRLASGVAYFPFGEVDHLVYGNGYVMEQDRDLSGRLSTYSVTHPGRSASLLDRTYVYRPSFDDLHAISDAADADFDQSFEYDDRHRLAGAVGAYGEYNYQYDEGGNRQTRAWGDGLG